MEASAKGGVLFGTFCLKCMQRELEYISKANAWLYENLCDKQLLGCVCVGVCVCVCVCVCVKPLERESFLMVYTEYQFLIF